MSASITLMILLSLAHLPWAVVLSVIDVREHRLPNVLVLGMSGSVVATAGVYALAVTPFQEHFVSTVAAASCACAAAVMLALVVPGSIGMGDAKVVFSTVLVSMLVSATALVYALIWICLAGAALAFVVMILTRGDLKARFAFGPVLLSAPYGGTSLAILVP